MEKSTLLFFTGESGAGKTQFIIDRIPAGLFYTLRSATTRKMRKKESEGHPYFFRDEGYFDTTPLATHLWVNEAVWKPGDEKWMYGVPEFEIIDHLGCNFIYDVIEPKYARQMWNWFVEKGLDKEYTYKIAWFIPPANSRETIKQRANMKDDEKVRDINTCKIEDFLDVGLRPDYILRPIKTETAPSFIDPQLIRYIDVLYDDMMRRQSKPQYPPRSNKR
ncbi:MAG: hypothetical protein J5613_03250 [Alphaproteobacteria bacterium]|nr:hypothetical protein [Alphaproteobacteria bacterium]